jgi:predicted GIY-YIG superfamily endonuclease
MLYVLALAHGKFYVGLSNRQNYSRVQDHFLGRAGCAWTNLHPPLRVILLLPTAWSTEDEEDALTLKIMHVHGWTNVRGGRWCTPTLLAPPILFSPSSHCKKCFRCQSTQHTSKDCQETTTLRCFRCDSVGHVVQDCPNPVRCFQCRETGHRSKDCLHDTKCFQCDQSGHTTRTCTNRVKCFRCNQPGHMASVCKKK